MNIMKEIRCPGRRGHRIIKNNTMTDYAICGSLLGGIPDNSEGLFRCPICKCFWHVETEEGDMEITGIKKGTHLELQKNVRTVNDTSSSE